MTRSRPSGRCRCFRLSPERIKVLLKGQKGFIWGCGAYGAVGIHISGAFIIQNVLNYQKDGENVLKNAFEKLLTQSPAADNVNFAK